jgi:hypothetical protein
VRSLGYVDFTDIVEFQKTNKRSLTPTRALCPFTPKAGVNGNPKTRASLTEFGMTSCHIQQRTDDLRFFVSA